ncbi:hypothetical protein MPF19_13730 [Polaribacter sp. Z014]|uniref:DUF4350 domain-containing protein n=1 Tax=Polaribacter sp. Z014 TaxID=2927126 RepID=UPI0020209ED4|nr:hypothetical protein [Polaribacter sp. Z014]MCL7764478.1 hypothetical protein [Polaribacter sp. Z014]
MKYILFLVFLFNLPSLCNAQKNQILLDNYYNNEVKGKTEQSYHYLWDDEKSTGFSEFGKLFREEGFTLSSLKLKPNKQNLKDAKVYIIVDPDNNQEAIKPNFMDAKTAIIIADWVKYGGTLLILANDFNNCDLDSLNLLATKFDLKFNKDALYQEKPKLGKFRNFDSCSFVNLPDNQFFKGVGKIFIKGLSSISCKNAATPVLKDKENIIIAQATYGKGKVVAIGDPWLYNEYIGHYSLPTEFNNQQAARNLVEVLTTK